METKLPLLIIALAIIIALVSGYEQMQSVTSKDNPPDATVPTPTSSNYIAPGELLERIVSLKDGASMVLIPAGDFLMGSSDTQYEVTNAQFQKFVKETGYVTDAEREGWGYLWEGFNDWPRVKGREEYHAPSLLAPVVD